MWVGVAGLVFGDTDDDEIEYPNLQYHFAPVLCEYTEGSTDITLRQG